MDVNTLPRAKVDRQSRAKPSQDAIKFIDQLAGIQTSWPEARQRKARLLFLICVTLTPLLPIMVSTPGDLLGVPLQSLLFVLSLIVSGALLAAMRLIDATRSLGLIYGVYLVALMSFGPLLLGETDNVSLIVLMLIPLIMGFTAGATASAIGTLLVLLVYYGVIVSGIARHDIVSYTGLTLIAYASTGTMICGVLVFYFTSLAQNESNALNRDNARIRTMALTDPLTKLWNRRAFQLEIDRLSTKYGSGVHPALFILDLDGFKQINDTHGHDVGDKVLSVFARRIKMVIGDGCKVYRLGGDEFAIICNNDASLSVLEVLAKKVTTLTKQPIEARSVKIEFDVSIGIAVSDGSAKSVQSLYQQADMAAFVAKENSGSTYIIFDKMLDSRANRKFEVEQALKTAIDYKSINVAFQPQVDLRSGAIIAYEALARWKDPVLGSVSPGEFIEIAEETSLVKVLDRLIISKALLSAGVWLGKHQRVSVNASARSLNSNEFAAFVIRQAELSGLQASQVEVEITETSLIQDWERSKRTVEALREAGIRIVLDDFGVGYSSLSYLVEFPVQKIKFDRSFLLKATDGSSVLVMQSIADLAIKMGVDLIAEGVETMEQLELLKSINCFTGQGYLLSRPILSEKMVEHTQSVHAAA